MLQWALDRARGLVPLERTVAIVAQEHRELWETELEALPRENVVVQPKNRGTAAGVLLPLVRILDRDPEAIVCVLPSDHYIEEERTFRDSLELATRAVADRLESVVLLAMTPDDVDTEYGWILPGPGRDETTRRVERFVEKPDATMAAELHRQGARWNSFVFAAAGRTLLRVFEETVPALVDAFRRARAAHDPRALEALYEEIESEDFSRGILERAIDRLRVVAVPACGWSDLGTPSRLRRFVEAEARLAPARALSEPRHNALMGAR
jgi:mannose-1-phosphate guanylyltransferase